MSEYIGYIVKIDNEKEYQFETREEAESFILDIKKGGLGIYLKPPYTYINATKNMENL